MAEHFDVLIIGAGLSGIGAAHHLQRFTPHKSYAILEGRGAMGGTWDLFRYPGIRSDSDMHTLGYRMKPWIARKSIADGPAILDYIHETSHENGIDEHIRYHQRVVRADWSTPDARWTVTVERTDTQETLTYTAGFLFGCTGYYDYEKGFTPEFAGREDFAGTVVHPQHWPQDLDHSGKRVVVIGSGATAVTLVPELARTAAHVTMLQRSPTYIVAMPDEDPLANLLRRFLPDRVSYPIVRWKNVVMSTAFYHFCKRRPELAKKFLRKGVEAQLPAGYDIDKHFTPRYNPWDQRVCLVPHGDLFRAIRNGDADVVTDHIERFVPSGIELKSGEVLEADVIVTATGLNLLPIGGLQFSVDGEQRPLGEQMIYKGMMVGGVPNFAFSVGYTNASWTLKCDLTCEYVVRLLQHMDRTGTRICVAENDPSVNPVPFLDFQAGYVLRSLDAFPKGGDRAPWRLKQNYAFDLMQLRHGQIDDGTMRFRNPSPASRPQEPVAA